MNLLSGIWRCASRFIPASKHDVQKLKEIMATIADLDSEIAGDLTYAATAIETALANLLAKVTVPPDVQPEVDQIKAIASALKAAAAGTATTVIVPPAPVTPPASSN